MVLNEWEWKAAENGKGRKALAEKGKKRRHER
jgi:hypothetical protein